MRYRMLSSGFWFRRLSLGEGYDWRSGNFVDRATFATWESQDEVGAMKRIVSTIAFSLAVTALPALAQTNNSPNVSTPSGQNSGAGISGYPGNKYGPAAKGTVGSSTSASQQNSTVQDAAKMPGMPGNKSGPPANKPPR